MANEATAEAEEALEREETAAQKKRRKQREEAALAKITGNSRRKKRSHEGDPEGVDKDIAAALAKIKGSKSFKRHKRIHEGEPEGDDEDLAWDMYTKKAPLPGQLENCEICEKRFTVTPYSKTGPEGGLLCAKCSKEQEAQKKKDEKQKKKKQPVSREKRRQIQSNLLDGILETGAEPLLELCIKVGKPLPLRRLTSHFLSDFGSRRLQPIFMTFMSLAIFHPLFLIV